MNAVERQNRGSSSIGAWEILYADGSRRIVAADSANAAAEAELHAPLSMLPIGTVRFVPTTTMWSIDVTRCALAQARAEAGRSGHG